MAIKDVFLPLVGEPDAAAIAAIDKCVAVAGDLGARVSAMAVEEDIPDPANGNGLERPGQHGGGRRRSQRIGRARSAERVRFRHDPLWRSQRASADPASPRRIFRGTSRPARGSRTCRLSW